MPKQISSEPNLLRASILRISKDAIHRSFWASVLIALIFTFLFFNTPAVNFEIKDITSLIIGYSSISFGACLTVLVLSLNIPGNDRIGRWASHKNENIKINAYLDLVIGLAFSALVQAILLGYTLFSSLLQGPGPFISKPGNSIDYLYILLLIFLINYSFTRIYIVLETVWQVAQIISAEEKLNFEARNKDKI
ncbi:hypothetical protein [Rothia sp. P4278]|uniref:hypothetical protein n=1 Tax=Rothia sp. P4278 TaxID=3402658 RepID=UPI003AE3FE77